MSRQEKAIYIEKLRNALQSYRGFTQIEKNYAHIHLPNWIETKGELDVFMKKFSEKFSINVQPFLFDLQITK
jgi:hypothetical protein